MATITFADTPKLGAGTRTKIPPELASDMEAVWEYLRDNPGKEALAQEADKASLDKYLRLCRIYLDRRDGGSLTLRRLPSDHLPDGTARFTIKPAAEKE